jgi:uncharacterized protein YjiS (DUF1127 family)
MNTMISRSAFDRSFADRGLNGASILERVTAALGSYMNRFAQRVDLADLDDRMLKDIGVSHADRLRETDKPFWA